MIPAGEKYRIAGFITLLFFVPIWYYITNTFKKNTKLSWVIYGYSLLLVSTLSGVFQEIFLFNVLSSLEQFCIFLTSVIFAYGSYSANKRLRGL